MLRRAVTFVSVLAVMAGAQASAGQQAVPAGQPPDQQQNQPKSAIPGLGGRIKVDQGGTILFTEHLGVVFGGIKQGSSIAVGPAASWKFENGSYVQIKGGFSLRKFKLLQARYDSPALFNDRAIFSTRLRWQDAPELPLFQPGPDSPNRHLDIGMTKTEWSAFIRTHPARHTSVTAGSGVEGYSSKGRWADLAEAFDRLGALPDAPGLATRPWYIRSFVSAAYDTRLDGDVSRTGHALDAGFFHYHDGSSGTQSFQRVEIGALTMIPTFYKRYSTGHPRTRYRGALRVFARTWLSHSGTGDEVPIYLQTYLGGGDYLRGYSSYRFHDRNALLVGTEYRHAVHKMVDVAVLVEGGTVARTPSVFSLRDFAPSAAVGLRVHKDRSGLLRLDLARGRDGFKFAIGISAAAGS